MKAGIAVPRSGVGAVVAIGWLMLTASVHGQGLVEDFNAASGTGGATVFSGSGFYELNGWDEGLLGEWAYGGTFGDGAITSVDAAGSTTGGVGGSGAGLLSVTDATFVDGGWFAGLFWPNVSLPASNPAQVQLSADVLGSVAGGAYQLRLEGYRIVPFGLNENFETVLGSDGHIFFDSTSGPTGAMENWDEGISGEQAFAGFNGGGTVNGNVMALGVTDGGVGGGGAGQLIVTDLVPDPGGSWYAGLSWPGQILPTTDRTQVTLTADIKGEINGGTLGDYMLRIEDADIDFLAFKMTANGEFQSVGGPLSDAIEDGVGIGDGLFDPAKGPFSVVVVTDNDLADTWGSGAKITVDNLYLTGGDTSVLLGAVSFDGVADGGTFQSIGGTLSTGNSTLVNVNEDFEGVVGPGPTGGVFFDATSGFEGYTPNWDDGINGEAAFAGISGLVTVNGDARALGTATGGAGGTAGGRLRVTGLVVQGGCAFNGWWGGLSWAYQHIPDGPLENIILLANVKGTAVSGGTAGNFTLRIEDADLDTLGFTLPSNGQFRTIGGALSSALPGDGFGPNSDGVFDRTHGPFTVVVAFDDPCVGWGPGGQLDVDNLSLTQAAFGTGVETWSVALSFADEMLSWGSGGTLTVDNLGLTELIPTAPDPLVAVDGGNRYLRVEAPPSSGGAGPEALRVRFVALNGYEIPAQDFLYVGLPIAAPEEDSAKPGLTFTAAPLSCDPVFHEWSGEGTVAIYGGEIIPGSVYEMQRAGVGCSNLSDETCWSDPVTITTLKYGDIWTLFAGPSNPPQPDFNDIAAMVRKFQSSGSKCVGGSNDGLLCSDDAACPGGTCDITAPLKATSQLQPNAVFPLRPIDFKDIAADVAAFAGSSYAAINAGPCTCPSSVTCGATPCVSDLNCSGGLCVNGFCGDACGRCAPPTAE